MSRRPLLDMVQASLVVPRGEDGFWAIVLDLDRAGDWTVRMVADRTNVATGIVGKYVRKLLAGGYAELVGETPRPHRNLAPAKVYRLVKKPVIGPRLRPDGTELAETANDQLWRTMKMSKAFSSLDLADLCPRVSHSAARGYIFALAAAGVVAKVSGKGDEARYRLVRNLGLRAPRILRAKLVFDPNANVVVGASVTREVQP